MEDIQDSQSSQQYSQTTQPASQQEWVEGFDNIWGYLEPYNGAVSRISFSCDKFRYELGRQDTNDFVLSGQTVSGKHCIITWDGCYQNSSVTVLDESLNGTFINGVKITKGNTAVLRHGNEISLSQPGKQGRDHEDYRFIYRHVASLPMTTFEINYDVLEDLGRGSFGVVKKAHCRTTSEYVAVKILKDAKAFHNQKSNLQSHNFRREIEVLQMLKHENICELREAFFWENDIYLILELVEGGDFYTYLFQHSPLSEVDSQHFTYQICDALAYIHSRNVTHRDVKPENILLTKDKPPVVKVADFGLAKFVHSQTMLKTCCGSPAYVAPEIIDNLVNSEGYDNLVDSWSVGVMVFSMLTRSSPFIEDGQEEDRRIIDWTPLANQNPSLEAKNFIDCLLQANPRQRMTLTNALDHAWFAKYTPVYDRKTEINSRNIKSTVEGDATYSGYSLNCHIGSLVASDDPEVQFNALAPTPVTGKADQRGFSSLGPDEYPPGLLKSTKQ